MRSNCGKYVIDVAIYLHIGTIVIYQNRYAEKTDGVDGCDGCLNWSGVGHMHRDQWEWDWIFGGM